MCQPWLALVWGGHLFNIRLHSAHPDHFCSGFGEWAAQGNILILILDFKESGTAEVPEWLLPFL